MNGGTLEFSSRQGRENSEKKVDTESRRDPERGTEVEEQMDGTQRESRTCVLDEQWSRP